MSIVAKRLPISAAAELLLELQKLSDLDLDLGWVEVTLVHIPGLGLPGRVL